MSLNWKDWKSKDHNLIRVDDFDHTALAYFFENSLRMGNDINSNVEIATCDPQYWINDIVEHILENVKYICTLPCFNTYKYENDNLYSSSLKVTEKNFNSIDEIVEFIKENSKFKPIALYTIVKYVDLKTINSYFIMKYFLIEDTIEIRNNKLEYLKL